MADTQILAAGAGPVPLDYTVPNAQEILLKCVHVQIDGSLAASSYLPCVDIIGDSGITIARVFGSSVTAGGSADATFFPGITPQAQQSSSAGLPWAIASFDPAGMSVPSDSATHYFSIHDTGGASKFDTSDNTIFTNGSTTAFTGSAVFGVQIHAAGTYMIQWNVLWVAQGVTGNGVQGYYSMDTGVSGPSFFQAGRTNSRTGDNWDHTGATGLPHISGYEFQSTDTGNLPSTIAPFAVVQGGGASTVTADVAVFQLGSYVATRI